MTQEPAAPAATVEAEAEPLQPRSPPPSAHEPNSPPIAVCIARDVCACTEDAGFPTLFAKPAGPPPSNDDIGPPIPPLAAPLSGDAPLPPDGGDGNDGMEGRLGEGVAAGEGAGVAVTSARDGLPGDPFIEFPPEPLDVGELRSPASGFEWPFGSLLPVAVSSPRPPFSFGGASGAPNLLVRLWVSSATIPFRSAE